MDRNGLTKSQKSKVKLNTLTQTSLIKKKERYYLSIHRALEDTLFQFQNERSKEHSSR